jgi:hypothetical protein
VKVARGSRRDVDRGSTQLLWENTAHTINLKGGDYCSPYQLLKSEQLWDAPPPDNDDSRTNADL